MRIISFSYFLLPTLAFGKERPCLKKIKRFKTPKITQETLPGTPWRNGSASDSRSEGCVFESRRGHIKFSFPSFFHYHILFIGQRYSPIFWRIPPSFSQIFERALKKHADT